MYPSHIAFIVTSILWVIALVLRRQAKRKEDLVSEGVFLTIEISLIGFLWVFLGLSHDWW